MTQVLLVAPYASVLAGLRVLLAQFADITIVGEARDQERLAYLLTTIQPDAVLYDASTNAMVDVLSILQNSGVPLVALCDEGEAALLLHHTSGGCSALGRSAGAEEIAAGIQAAVAGIVALDPAFARDLLVYEAIDDRTGAIALTSDPTLTSREREVLQLMTQGLPNKNIAGRLRISLSTAKFHVASILSKLEASSRTEAVAIGARRGLVSL